MQFEKLGPENLMALSDAGISASGAEQSSSELCDKTGQMLFVNI